MIGQFKKIMSVTFLLFSNYIIPVHDFLSKIFSSSMTVSRMLHLVKKKAAQIDTSSIFWGKKYDTWSKKSTKCRTLLFLKKMVLPWVKSRLKNARKAI